MLEGYSFDLAQEERSVVDTREMLSMRGMFNMLHTTQADRYTGLSQNELESIRSLSRTAKSEVALWIKDSFELLAARELYNYPLSISRVFVLTMTIGLEEIAGETLRLTHACTSCRWLR